MATDQLIGVQQFGRFESRPAVLHHRPAVGGSGADWRKREATAVDGAQDGQQELAVGEALC